MNRRLLTAGVVALASIALASGSAGAKDHHPASQTVDPCNDRLAIQVAEDGTFNLGAFPDATTCGPLSGSWDLLYRWPDQPGTSYTTVRVDGADEIYGRGTVVRAPADVDATTNESAFRHGDIVVTQRLALAGNSQTGEFDAAQVTYTVENTGSASHAVGIRAMLDTEINYNDGAPFRVPGVGAVTNERDFTGAAIPDSFQVFFSLTDATHVGAATLRGGSATVPDRLAIAAWPRIVESLWDFGVDETVSITDDSAYAVWWNAEELAPGASRTYTTYYGLGAVDVDLTPPLALGVSGPATLACTGGAYDPNPFQVTATVLNNGAGTATDVTTTLNLPDGLSLASGASTRALGDLAPGAEVQVSWSVSAEPRASAATLTWSVTADGSNTDPKTVSRGIDLPACQANRAPVASDASVATNEDTPVGVTLGASDPDGDSLTYSVVNGPAHGSLSGTPPALTYTPAANYNGPDSFTFKANDGSSDSNVATVSITVAPVDDPPIAIAQTVTTDEDTDVAVILRATDPDGDALTYSVVTGPAHAVLTGSPPNLTYTPAGDYNGSDSFTFVAHDGRTQSNAATVSITIAPVNDAPVAHDDAAGFRRGESVQIQLTGADVDGDTLTFSIATRPTLGQVTVDANGVATYTPRDRDVDEDSFTFVARDGTAVSEEATVDVFVAPASAGPRSARARTREWNLNGSFQQDLFCGGVRCGFWRQGFSEQLSINSGDYDDASEIGLNFGDTYARINVTINGRRFVPYAICIRDSWTAVGDTNFTFIGTAGLVFFINMEPDMFPQVFGAYASLSYEAGGRPFRPWCRFNTTLTRNPLPGNGNYYVQFSSSGRGEIDRVKHTQTATIYFTRSAFENRRADLRHTISDRIILDD